jgi:hypothetical protein
MHAIRVMVKERMAIACRCAIRTLMAKRRTPSRLSPGSDHRRAGRYIFDHDRVSSTFAT